MAGEYKLSYTAAEVNEKLGQIISKEEILSEMPTKVSQLENDANYITSEDIQDTENDIETLKSQVADLMYKEIEILSFTNNIGTVEKGSTINSVTLTWTLNKTPQTLTLDGNALDTSLTTKTVTETVTTDRKFTLKAVDEREKTAQKTTSIVFLNGVYYGVVKSGAEVGPSMLAGMTKRLLGTVALDFSRTAGEGQKIAYAAPLSYSTPAFKDKDSGFAAGFDKAGEFEYTNEKGWTEMYQLWLSTNENLGTTNISVSKG